MTSKNDLYRTVFSLYYTTTPVCWRDHSPQVRKTYSPPNPLHCSVPELKVHKVFEKKSFYYEYPKISQILLLVGLSTD